MFKTIEMDDKMEEWHFNFQPNRRPALVVTDWVGAGPVCLDLLARAPEPGEGPL